MRSAARSVAVVAVLVVAACSSRKADKADDVKALGQTPITELQIKPKGQLDSPPDPIRCETPKIILDTERTTLTSKHIARHHDGAFDPAWLVEQLRELKEQNRECFDVEVEAGEGVRYQDLIAAMDVSIQAGFPNVGLGGTKAPPPAAGSASGSSSGLTGNEPVIVVTKDEIQLDGKTVATIKDVLAAKGDRIPPLVRVLPKATGSQVAILQADASTDSRVVSKIVTSANAAGYRDLMFAVKKSP